MTAQERPAWEMRALISDVEKLKHMWRVGNKAFENRRKIYTYKY